MDLSNIKVCPCCNSQNIITEYDWIHDVYIILCGNCGERREVKGEDFV